MDTSLWAGAVRPQSRPSRSPVQQALILFPQYRERRPSGRRFLFAMTGAGGSGFLCFSGSFSGCCAVFGFACFFFKKTFSVSFSVSVPVSVSVPFTVSVSIPISISVKFYWIYENCTKVCNHGHGALPCPCLSAS